MKDRRVLVERLQEALRRNGQMDVIASEGITRRRPPAPVAAIPEVRRSIRSGTWRRLWPAHATGS